MENQEFDLTKVHEAIVGLAKLFSEKSRSGTQEKILVENGLQKVIAGASEDESYVFCTREGARGVVVSDSGILIQQGTRSALVLSAYGIQLVKDQKVVAQWPK